jgi:CRP-like cAMP-binding protein
MTRQGDPLRILDLSGITGTVVTYRKSETVYAQGDRCTTVMYLREGEVTLSVRSKAGREAIVTILGPGQFFGEGGLAGQRVRMGSATANTPSTVLVIDQVELLRRLHEEHALSDRFIAHLLARNIRTEEDLIDQLTNSAEKRLAQVLLRLARCGEPGGPDRSIPGVSVDTLAEMAGTTASRVKTLLKRFRKEGFIEGDDGLTIHRSLLTVLLND